MGPSNVERTFVNHIRMSPHARQPSSYPHLCIDITGSHFRQGKGKTDAGPPVQLAKPVQMWHLYPPSRNFTVWWLMSSIPNFEQSKTCAKLSEKGATEKRFIFQSEAGSLRFFSLPSFTFIRSSTLLLWIKFQWITYFKSKLNYQLRSAWAHARPRHDVRGFPRDSP